jgi:spermidine/putrescine transport system ATP-binding protein
VGITFVYVTHDQEEALTMSDRIAVMNHGRVEQIAPPEDVYERPSTTFVAGFIGVSNLMPGTVGPASNGRVTVALDTGVEVAAEAPGLSPGERCHAVVRPEKLRIDRRDGQPPAGWTAVEGQVESSVFLGTATQIVVVLPGDVRMTVLVPNADESERSELPGGGATVRLSWAPEHMHVVRESSQTPTSGSVEPGGQDQ